MNATEKLLLQSQVNALKASIDATSVDAPPVVTPPPAPTWPRIAPDVLNIDLTGPDAVLKAKMLDGSPGYDGKGGAIHYGSMSGDVVYTNGVANMDQKFSNPSVKPVWGNDNGLYYLESASDAGFSFATGVTANRLINWGFALPPRVEYWSRYMVWYDPICLRGQGNIGIKGSGLGGQGMSHTFEIGPALGDRWEAQDYVYDGEGAQRVERFGFSLFPAAYYTIEQHVKANTTTLGVGNRDGVVEYKINGVSAFSRKNVLLFPYGGMLTSFQMQFYDGGMLPVHDVVPSSDLRARHARIAVSTKGWIGPAPEVAP